MCLIRATAATFLLSLPAFAVTIVVAYTLPSIAHHFVTTTLIVLAAIFFAAWAVLSLFACFVRKGGGKSEHAK